MGTIQELQLCPHGFWIFNFLCYIISILHIPNDLTPSPTVIFTQNVQNLTNIKVFSLPFSALLSVVI